MHMCNIQTYPHMPIYIYIYIYIKLWKVHGVYLTRVKGKYAQGEGILNLSPC
jgi:hypothetical protein